MRYAQSVFRRKYRARSEEDIYVAFAHAKGRHIRLTIVTLILPAVYNAVVNRKNLYVLAIAGVVLIITVIIYLVKKPIPKMNNAPVIINNFGNRFFNR